MYSWDSISDIMVEFVEAEGLVRYEDYGMTVDVREMIIILTGLCERLEVKGKLIFNSAQKVKDYYLQVLPQELTAVYTEIWANYEALLDFYEFLYRRKYLNRQAYQVMLISFQGWKWDFIENMSDENLWSDEKREMIEELEELMFSDDFEQDFAALEDETE